MTRIGIRQILVNPAKYRIDLAYVAPTGERAGGVVFLDMVGLTTCLNEIGRTQKASEIATRQEQGAFWALHDVTDDEVFKFQTEAL